LAPSFQPARLAIAVQHDIKQGRLKVWIDETLVMDRALVGSERKKLLFLKRSKGSLAEVVDVAPGERLVRLEVEVPGDRETRSGRLRSAFRSSETRLLEVKIGGRIALGWRS